MMTIWDFANQHPLLVVVVLLSAMATLMAVVSCVTYRNIRKDLMQSLTKDERGAICTAASLLRLASKEWSGKKQFAKRVGNAHEYTDQDELAVATALKLESIAAM